MFQLHRNATGPRPDGAPVNPQRRGFLRVAGYSAATALLVTACKTDADVATPGGSTRAARAGDIIKFGTGDVAVLNYAYALEQLEAAFYEKVVEVGTLKGREMTLFTDIRDHEIAHREFFKNALGSAAIPGLTPNFSSIDFTSRASILLAAMAFEDLGVQAYNGAGRFLKNADFLTLAGKIVSVEARHAAYVRDLMIRNNFSNTVDANGLDVALSPGNVLNVAGKFVMEGFDLVGSGLIG